jgi:hypothetical protein
MFWMVLFILAGAILSEFYVKHNKEIERRCNLILENHIYISLTTNMGLKKH